jgi:uncharacterized glyoxalase superfamily protein PhnB
VRIDLVVDDPDKVAQRAVAAGARTLFPIADQSYGGDRVALSIHMATTG